MVTRTIVTHHAQVTSLHPAFAITASALRIRFRYLARSGGNRPASLLPHPCPHSRPLSQACGSLPTLTYTLPHNHPLILPAPLHLQPPASSQQAALAVQPTSLSAPTPGLPPIGSTQGCLMLPRYCYPLIPLLPPPPCSFLLSLSFPLPLLSSASANLSSCSRRRAKGGKKGGGKVWRLP